MGAREIVAVGAVAWLLVGGAAVADEHRARVDLRRADRPSQVTHETVASRPERAVDLRDGRLEASLVARPRAATRTMSQQLADGFTALGDELDAHLAALSLELIGVRVDGRARAARLRLGRLADDLGAQLDGHVRFTHGRARIAARLAVDLAGHHLRIELPVFEVIPRSEFGDRYLELRLPLFEGAF